MAQTVAHTPDTDRYAALEQQIADLWEGLQLVVDGLLHDIDQVAAARGLPARPSRPFHPSRPDLRVVTR